MFIVFKTRELLKINFFLEIPIENYTFNIHMIQLEFHVYSKGYEHSNCLNAYDGGKGLIIVDPFFLIVALHHKSGLISGDSALFVQLVPEYPFGPYDGLMFRRGNQVSYLAFLKL